MDCDSKKKILNISSLYRNKKICWKFAVHSTNDIILFCTEFNMCSEPSPSGRSWRCTNSSHLGAYCSRSLCSLLVLCSIKRNKEQMRTWWKKAMLFLILNENLFFPLSPLSRHCCCFKWKTTNNIHHEQISDDDRMSLTTAISDEDDGESIMASPYKAKATGTAAASFNCTGAVRKAGWVWLSHSFRKVYFFQAYKISNWT